MKILFLSVTAGQGHNMCAKAAMEYLLEKGAECTMLDTFDYIHPLLGESIARSYILAVAYSPVVYAQAYRLAANRELRSYISFNRITHKLLSHRLETYVKAYNPDVIILTHVFAAKMVTELAKKWYKGLTIGIMTDFMMHPYWDETDLDYYVLASELLNNQFIKTGFKPEKILPFGIPIAKKFSFKGSVKSSVTAISCKKSVALQSITQ